jgi:methyltransferase (TIGR00027 family)
MATVADTAFSIAVVRAEESARPVEERLFEDPYAHLFAGAGEHVMEATRRYLDLPFFRDGVRLRTRVIDDAVREGLEGGLKQVVILGAGFDARGLRMREIAEAGASVFEVDTPDQLGRKRTVLAGAGIDLPASVAYVPFDFERTDFELGLTSALVSRGLQTGTGVLFVWEGVVGYIGSDAIDESLRFMARAGGGGTRAVFTYSDINFDPHPALDRIHRAGFTSLVEQTLDDAWRRHEKGEPHPGAALSKIGVASV